MRPIWYLPILAMGLLASMSNASASMNGYVDGFSFNSSGNPILNGWACVIGSATPITVQVYIGQPAPAGQYVGTFNSNANSEPAVASACQSTGTTYRYQIALGGYPVGSPTYVYAVSPADGSTLLLTNSGNETIPLQAPAGGDAVAYRYDNYGRISSLHYANGTVIQYSYDQAGNRQSVVTGCANSGC